MQPLSYSQSNNFFALFPVFSIKTLLLAPFQWSTPNPFTCSCLIQTVVCSNRFLKISICFSLSFNTSNFRRQNKTHNCSNKVKYIGYFCHPQFLDICSIFSIRVNLAKGKKTVTFRNHLFIMKTVLLLVEFKKIKVLMNFRHIPIN